MNASTRENWKEWKIWNAVAGEAIWPAIGGN